VQASFSGRLSGRFLPITATLQLCTAHPEEQRLCRDVRCRLGPSRGWVEWVNHPRNSRREWNSRWSNQPDGL